MAVDDVTIESLYKYCVVNSVTGTIFVCNSESEAVGLCDSKRKHDLNAVRGLPVGMPLAVAAKKRAAAYRVGKIVYL